MHENIRLEWRVIQDRWEVNQLGQVRRANTERLLKIRTRKDGYLDVKLGYRRFLTHRLVAIAFIPNPKNLPQVNHRDGNRGNADVSNLEWVDQFQNMKHAVATGLFPDRKGIRNGRSTLCEENVKEIKRMLAVGYSNKFIVMRFNSTDSIISNIKNNVTWRHVK